MREIKFRGKNSDGEWLTITKSELFDGSWGTIINQLTDNLNIRNLKPIPETVGQFTGLKDKNGKDVYEGDILEYYIVKNMGDGDIFSQSEYYYIKEIGEVEFSFCTFSIDEVPLTYVGIPSLEDARHLWFGNDDFDVNGNPIDESIVDIKIIGNIHDNPELLKTILK